MANKKEWASGRSWWQTATKPHGGFVLVREKAILGAWVALHEGRIGLRDFRVWLASFEAVERRIRARSRRTPRFTTKELHLLVGGVGGEHVRSSIRKLERAGLGNWSETCIELLGAKCGELKADGRCVPLPRVMLRHLAQAKGRAYLATGLGHLLRCLYFRDGLCISGGYCKSTWVADTFGVAVRGVKSARKELSRRGFLRTLDADQHRLNRYGAPVLILLGEICTSRAAPRRHFSTSENAPPSKHKNLSLRRSEHQKPGGARTRSGVSVETSSERRVTLNDVRMHDFESPARLVMLFHDAEQRGFVKRCEADKLAFFAAAAHAQRVGRANPAGLFAAIIRKRLYAFVTQRDEDVGRIALAAFREESQSDAMSARSFTITGAQVGMSVWGA